MTPLCTRICPYPFFEATPPGTLPDPQLKPGPVFVAFGGVTTTASGVVTAPGSQFSSKWHRAHR